LKVSVSSGKMEGVMKKFKSLECLFFVLLWPAALQGQIFGPSDRAGEYPGMSARLPGQGAEEDVQITAKPLWRQALGGSIIGLPAAQVQSVVVALDSGTVKACSSGGRLLWAYHAGGRISPHVSRSREGTCYLSRTSGVFIAVNRAGRELWRRSPGSPLSGPAVPGWDGRVFVPTGKRLSCYTNSGNLLWRREFDSPMAMQPRPGIRGGLLTVLDNGELLFIDPFGGIAGRRLSAVPRIVVPVGGSGGDRALVLYPSGAAEFIDPESPDRQPRILPRLPSPPLAAESRGNHAAVLMEGGGVILLSGEDGSFLWTGESHIGGADTQAAMIFDERGVYVLSRSGAAGFTADGRRLWYIRLEGAAAIPAFGDDGVLYSGGGDWILYAYKLEDRVRQGKQALYGPAPEGSYGTGNPPPSPWADFYYRFDEKELDARLDLVEKAIGEGRVGEEELAFTACLMETAAAGTENPHGSLTHPPVQVRHRVRALQLLSLIGSGETVPFLARLFSRDGEPLVRAAAAEAVGGIGLDPEGLALRSFTNALLSPSSSRDEQVQLAVAAAAGALCRFSGPPLSDTGIKILNLLTADSRPGQVRQRARRELASLRL
jgi:outer membrane protein assembly factor BamB